MVHLIETQRLQLLPAQAGHIRSMLAGARVFSQEFGFTLADGFLSFTEILYPTLAALENDPGIAPWWMHMVIHKGDSAVIGTAGYKGRPRGQVVELGYGIAPQYQNQGLATEAVKALAFNAITQHDVSTIAAHTAAHENASTRVLSKCAFQRIAEVNDPEDGCIWRWEYYGR